MHFRELERHLIPKLLTCEHENPVQFSESSFLQSRAQCYALVIPALGRRRQEPLAVRSLAPKTKWTVA